MFEQKVNKWVYKVKGKEFYRARDVIDFLGLSIVDSTVNRWFRLGVQDEKFGVKVTRELNEDYGAFSKTLTTEEEEVVYGFKERKCNKCHNTFTTEVDERGWAIKTVCPSCSAENYRIINGNEYNLNAITRLGK